jgi:hypothetical protein
MASRSLPNSVLLANKYLAPVPRHAVHLRQNTTAGVQIELDFDGWLGSLGGMA